MVDTPLPGAGLDLPTLRGRLEDYYRDMHTQMSEDDAYYEQKPPVTMALPDGVPMHIPATPTNIVDNMADQIRTDEPAIELKAKTEGDRDAVDSLQKWGQERIGYIRNWAEVDMYEQGKRDLIKRGAACAKVIVNPAWLDGDHDVEPYITRPIDPLSVYPSPGSTHTLRYMLEIQTRTVADLEQYKSWADPKGSKMRKARSKATKLEADNLAREVEWVEYWDDDRYVVEADGDRIIDEKNPYGFVPYIWRYSGMGVAHHDGNPVHLARGLLTDIHGELAAEIRIKTAWDAQWQYHVFPVLLVQANAKEAAKQLQVAAGRIVEWGKLGNTEPKWLDKPPPDAAMITFLDRIEASMKRQTGSVLQGVGGSGSQYGILEAMRIGQALKVISPVIKTLNSMGSQMLEMMARLAQEFDIEFQIRGSKQRIITIKGDVFTKRHFEVSFEAIDAAENDRRLLIGESLHDKGLISRRTFHEVYAKHLVESPDEEASWILAEQVEQQALESGVLLQAALANLQPQTTRAVQGAAAGVAGAAATPAGPGVPAPGMAGQIATEAMASSPGLTSARNAGVAMEGRLGV